MPVLQKPAQATHLIHMRRVEGAAAGKASVAEAVVAKAATEPGEVKLQDGAEQRVAALRARRHPQLLWLLWVTSHPQVSWLLWEPSRAWELFLRPS